MNKKWFKFNYGQEEVNSFFFFTITSDQIRNTCMNHEFLVNISAHTMRRHIKLSKLGYSSCERTWLYFFIEMRKFRNFSEKKFNIPHMIWSLNFLAYAEKFFSMTRWIGQIELHVTSASELQITWFRSIHWNFPLNYMKSKNIKSKLSKKPQVCILPFKILGPQMTRRVWLYDFQPFKKIKVWIFEILLIWHFNFLNTKYERLNLPNNC